LEPECVPNVREHGPGGAVHQAKRQFVLRRAGWLRLGP